ncbi:paraquat-inducible protein A [uncultured Tateyamaria sp.]|uniref:paraquat-inducible protein A n=1 Tax=uncultured Tateyamaria sp. TaxID=455651 RepID=UPI002615FFEE|nr:paraquat-inducible protein A [uncultured Tateyamaria sp.]
MHRWINLSLLLLFPLSWVAPLMRAGLLPLFGLSEISVMTGLHSLWDSDIFLALIVALFALIAPFLKTIALALIHWNRLDSRYTPILGVLGKLAMADIFLIALYITLAKGVGVGRLETAWGLYLFTACILASIWVSWRTEQLAKKTRIDDETETKIEPN